MYYVWGMSLRGVTVITNISPPCPCLIKWISGCFYIPNPTLTRFLLLHFVLHSVVCGFIIIHFIIYIIFLVIIHYDIILIINTVSLSR